VAGEVLDELFWVVCGVGCADERVSGLAHVPHCHAPSNGRRRGGGIQNLVSSLCHAFFFSCTHLA
jgi:hypothetical protein